MLRALLAALLLAGMAHTATAENPLKEYLPTGIKVRALEEENKELKATIEDLGRRLNVALGRRLDQVAKSREIGYSHNITCGEKMVTIPMIAEGKHILTTTIWKSDISSISYFIPEAFPMGRRNGNPMASVIVIGMKKTVGKDAELFTSKSNYASLLSCLD